MMILAATLVLSGTTAASASEPGALDAAVSNGSAPAAKERKYCIQYVAPTGSRIIDRQCKTKAAWAREGVNVDEPSKN